jgi:pyrroloquinoline quinone biosynthesis protein B
VYLRVVGVAAGGGYPQWNCACRLCRRARENGPTPRGQMHASLALSATGKNWYLVNATPDIRFQIESFPSLHPGPGLRETRLRGILLTDAELDHSIGLLILREGSTLNVHGTSAVLASLAEQFPVSKIIQPYARFHWHEVKLKQPFLLDEDNGRLRVTAFSLGAKRPRYTIGSSVEGDWVIGYRFEDVQTGGSAVYAPAIEAWSDELSAELAGADCAFVDGTFWSENEMIHLGVSTLTAGAMGHIPISGAEGSLEHLSALRTRRKILVHINNTNPILDERSQERRLLAASGIEVGWDGMELEV